MSYRIKPYSYQQAKALGVQIRRSKSISKKIDVFQNGRLVAKIGAIGYLDYPAYLELEVKGRIPKGTAAKKRKAYWARSGNTKKGTPGWYAQRILW